MLRSRLTQPVRFQRLELIKGGSERRHVQLGFEGKVISVGFHPQQFELDKGKHRRHDRSRATRAARRRRAGATLTIKCIYAAGDASTFAGAAAAIRDSMASR